MSCVGLVGWWTNGPLHANVGTVFERRVAADDVIYWRGETRPDDRHRTHARRRNCRLGPAGDRDQAFTDAGLRRARHGDADPAWKRPDYQHRGCWGTTRSDTVCAFSPG